MRFLLIFSDHERSRWCVALSTGNLVSLSKQQFVECDTTDSGCNGGWMDIAFSFAQKKIQSVPKEVTLSPQQTQGGVVGYTDVATDSEQAMMSAMAQQLVRVSTIVFWPSVTELTLAQTSGR